MKVDVQSVADELGISSKHIPLLINSFLEESISIMSRLGRAIEENDLDTVALEAHSIKGSAGNLRIHDVQKKALEIELAGKSKDQSFNYASELAALQMFIDSIEF